MRPRQGPGCPPHPGGRHNCQSGHHLLHRFEHALTKKTTVALMGREHLWFLVKAPIVSSYNSHRALTWPPAASLAGPWAQAVVRAREISFCDLEIEAWL